MVDDVHVLRPQEETAIRYLISKTIERTCTWHGVPARSGDDTIFRRSPTTLLRPPGRRPAVPL